MMTEKNEATPVILHGAQYWKIGDDVYLKVGNQLVKVDHFDKDNKPVIGSWSEETPNAAGGHDCTVHVNCFQIAATPHQPT